jgi:endonuclease YncB( thermonuclease family)
VFGLIALGAVWYAYELGSLGSGFASAGFGRTLEGQVTRVRDGDTIAVGGTPVRFANLDCAELGTLQVIGPAGG